LNNILVKIPLWYEGVAGETWHGT